MDNITRNNGRSWLSNIGTLPSLMERRIRMSSDSSGYLNFRFPAVVSTDLMARIPKQQTFHCHSHINEHIIPISEYHAIKYMFSSLLFLSSIIFLTLSHNVLSFIIKYFLLTIHIIEMHGTKNCNHLFKRSVTVVWNIIEHGDYFMGWNRGYFSLLHIQNL